MAQFEPIEFDEAEMRYNAYLYFSRSLRRDMQIVSDDYLDADPEFTYLSSTVALMKLKQLEDKVLEFRRHLEQKKNMVIIDVIHVKPIEKIIEDSLLSFPFLFMIDINKKKLE